MPLHRLLVLSSHPIQYQAPIYRALAAHPEIDLTVLFCSDWGVKPYQDPGFGRQVQWDTPLLDGYHYKFLRNWSPRPGLDRMWGVLNPAVVASIASRRYDAVLIHGWARATNWLAIVAALASRTPIILRGETNLLNPLPRVKRLIKMAVLKRLFSVSSGFLSIGWHNTEFYRSWDVPREKIHLSPYAVDNDFWLAQADKFSGRRSQLKCDLGFDREIPVILFSGKLTDAKRPFDLLLAFEKISRKLACGLVFLGDGRLRKRLESYARERMLMNVRFVGFRNQTEMAPFYAVADIFVLPSGREPWGLVVNEAMCFGLPIIASDKVGASGDLLRPGENGFIYPAGDVVQLAKYLATLLIDPAPRLAAGQASKSLIQNWGITESVDGVLQCLRRLIAPPADSGILAETLDRPY